MKERESVLFIYLYFHFNLGDADDYTQHVIVKLGYRFNTSCTSNLQNDMELRILAVFVGNMGDMTPLVDKWPTLCRTSSDCDNLEVTSECDPDQSDRINVMLDMYTLQ